MNQECVVVEVDVVQGGCGFVKFNFSLCKVYELVLCLKDVFGDFVLVKGVVQYDVINEDQCGYIELVIGMVVWIISQELVELCKVVDGEYWGMLYVDCMLDEDYYGCGVCRWEFIGVGVMLKVMGVEEEICFFIFVDVKLLIEGGVYMFYYLDLVYLKVDCVFNFFVSGEFNCSNYVFDFQDKLFMIIFFVSEVVL